MPRSIKDSTTFNMVGAISRSRLPQPSYIPVKNLNSESSSFKIAKKRRNATIKPLPSGPMDVKVFNIINRLTLINRVQRSFLNHEPSSPILRTLWTEIIFLSYFRQKDREYLRTLHKDPIHDNSLHAITKFLMYQLRLDLMTGCNLSFNYVNNSL